MFFVEFQFYAVNRTVTKLYGDNWAVTKLYGVIGLPQNFMELIMLS